MSCDTCMKSPYTGAEGIKDDTGERKVHNSEWKVIAFKKVVVCHHYRLPSKVALNLFACLSKTNYVLFNNIQLTKRHAYKNPWLGEKKECLDYCLYTWVMI